MADPEYDTAEGLPCTISVRAGRHVPAQVAVMRDCARRVVGVTEGGVTVCLDHATPADIERYQLETLYEA